jgi:mannose-1-phosphate guanylyltransferase
MITVIIAGGSGTRLWPLSTPDYPKHLLKLIDNTSLLQAAYNRAKRAGEHVYVVTEQSHSQHVKDQLPELPEEAFLIEPGRRGTGNCIIFALDVISRNHDHDEPIAFVHSDHHVRDTDGYVKSLHIAADSSKETNRITLIGIEPTFPATGFGYIERDGALNKAQTVYNIESFKEKPDYDTAKKYLKAGRYLWNCGYFVGSVNTFLDEINAVSPELTDHFDKLAEVAEPMSDAYNKAYLAFDDQVIDYALSEKSHNLAVVPASFDWMDLGSFKDLHDAVEKDKDENHFHGDNVHTIDVENVFVRNEEEKPVAVIGLDNVVVVNTPNGILVARKDVSQRVGEIAKKIQA